MSAGVLYVVVTAAGATRQVPSRLLPLAAERGWDVHVLATDHAARTFPETMRQIAELAGRPVRTDFHTTVGYSLPDPDAVIVAPATYNTLTKWALGIADTYVLTRLAEQVGRGVPIAAGPYVNVRFAGHPTYQGSLATLKEWGVHVVLGPREPHESADGAADDFPWQELLDTVTPASGGPAASDGSRSDAATGRTHEQAASSSSSGVNRTQSNAAVSSGVAAGPR